LHGGEEASARAQPCFQALLQGLLRLLVNVGLFFFARDLAFALYE